MSHPGIHNLITDNFIFLSPLNKTQVNSNILKFLKIQLAHIRKCANIKVYRFNFNDHF